MRRTSEGAQNFMSMSKHEQMLREAPAGAVNGSKLVCGGCGVWSLTPTHLTSAEHVRRASEYQTVKIFVNRAKSKISTLESSHRVTKSYFCGPKARIRSRKASFDGSKLAWSTKSTNTNFG